MASTWLFAVLSMGLALLCLTAVGNKVWLNRPDEITANKRQLRTTPIVSVEQYIGTERSMEHDGLTRWFIEHQPKNFKDNSALLIQLHWGGGNMISSVGGGRVVEKDPWLRLSAQHGFLVLSPNGTRQRKRVNHLITRGIKQQWNDIIGEGLAATGADDVGFIAAMVEWAIKERNVDPKRVYITGVSNGGTMTYRMVVERPDLFAAAAAFVANMPERDVELPAAPTPIFIMEGTKDEIMPYNGGLVSDGRRGHIRSAEATRDYFVQANGAGPDVIETELPSVTPDDGCRIVSQYYPSATAPVAFYKMDGGGHIPPGEKLSTVVKMVADYAIGHRCRDVDGIELAWKFMSQFSLPEQKLAL